MDDLLFNKYQKYLAQFERSYENMEEMNRRFQIFKTNYLLAKLEDDGIDHSEADSEKLFGTTEFMDMSPEEFEGKYLTLNNTDLPDNTTHYFTEDGTSKENGRFLEEIPENWDWRAQGAVSPVRNQGLCGGCWAFSAVSNIESQIFIKTGRLPSFSEQQLIDCDYNNSGCLGGLMHRSFNYILQNGLQNRDSYPFEWKQGSCNRTSINEREFVIKGFMSAGTSDEEKIKEMLYKFGPLSITINARLLQYYRGGVLNVPYNKCPFAPNHGVNLVGYGQTARGLKYWIVRNTWGPKWGEGGYFRIRRGNGLCGVNGYVVSAIPA